MAIWRVKSFGAEDTAIVVMKLNPWLGALVNLQTSLDNLIRLCSSPKAHPRPNRAQNQRPRREAKRSLKMRRCYFSLVGGDVVDDDEEQGCQQHLMRGLHRLRTIGTPRVQMQTA